MADDSDTSALPVPRRVFYGTVIHSVHARKTEFIYNALLGVNAAGIISFVDHDVSPDQVPARLKERGWDNAPLMKLDRGEWLQSSFVDTHTHAPQYANLGFGGRYQLLDWLKHVTFPREAQFENLAYAKMVYEGVVTRVINSGTTTCCYYGTLHKEATELLATICHQKGQRAFVGKVCMDANAAPNYQEKSASISLNETKEFIRHVRSTCCASTVDASLINGVGEYIAEPQSPSSVSSHGSSLMTSEAKSTALVQPILTPRFAIACTDALLSSLGALATRDLTLPIQTHLSENTNEIAFTKELFPWCDTYASVYDNFKLLRHNTILAHCVHLEESEIDLIAKRQAGISHCPTSNFNIRSGMAPVAQYMDRGIKVGLGTDCSGGYGCSILTTLRDAAIASKMLSLQESPNRPPSPDATTARARSKTPTRANAARFSDQHLSIDTLFFLATLGGAQVCNLEDRIGNLQPGKEFDALLIQTGQKRPQDMKARAGTEEDLAEAMKSLPDPFPGAGFCPNLFAEPEDSVAQLFEKFLFTGDDRNIGSVFVRGRVVGGARPIQ